MITVVPSCSRRSRAIRGTPPTCGARPLRSAAAFSDNPVAVLTLVFVGLFVATDIVNRVQSSKAFLTPKQVSTTFLYAAIPGLMAAGETLVMLTGGVDLSVATTATTGAFMISSFATNGAAKAIGVALVAGLGIGIVNGIGVAIFRAPRPSSSRSSAPSASSPTSRMDCSSGGRCRR